MLSKKADQLRLGPIATHLTPIVRFSRALSDALHSFLKQVLFSARVLNGARPGILVCVAHMLHALMAQSFWTRGYHLPAWNQAKKSYLARGILLGGVAVFTVYFCAYLFAQQDAFLTHAEDMGIMMQALWTTTHGAVLHQTICNPVSDSNCLGDTSRFAIHVEPIMLPLALLYAVAPSAKTLQLIQVLVVVSGAFPAYALASRRLGTEWAGAVFAALYLLNPSLDSALTFDFHAVTLSAAFIMFALYFLSTRNNTGFVVASVLAMSTKEEVGLVIAMLGAAAFMFQNRRRFGTGVVLGALSWVLIAFAMIKWFSPDGQSPLISRYAGLGNSPGAVITYVLGHPLSVLHTYILSPDRITYLNRLLSPLGYLPLLSPVSFVVGSPIMLINMLSSKQDMFSGGAQYNAEIVPVLIFATLEGCALVMWLVARAASAFATIAHLRVLGTARRLSMRWVRLSPRLPRVGMRSLVLSGLLLVLVSPTWTSIQASPVLPISPAFTWPTVTAHTQLGEQLSEMVPASASVSAQGTIVPHVSNRRAVYQFPEGAHDADFVLLDVTADTYPLSPRPDTDSSTSYCSGIEDVLDDIQYGVLLATDGYLVLGRNVADPIPISSPAVQEDIDIACD